MEQAVAPAKLYVPAVQHGVQVSEVAEVAELNVPAMHKCNRLNVMEKLGGKHAKSTQPTVSEKINKTEE